MFSFLRKIIPPSFIRGYHYILAVIAAWVYNSPSEYMTVIGVTGTNGKSSVVELVRAIFESAGFNTASLSSIRTVINGKEEMNMQKMTMPGRFALQRFLKRAHGQGVTHAVLEATSEGIRQFRHRGIAWDGLVFTNLAPEHIESHGSFEKYKAEKEKLFQYLSSTSSKTRIPKIIVVNGDDPHGRDFLSYKADKKWIYGIHNVHANQMASLLHEGVFEETEDVTLIVPSFHEVTPQGIRFVVEGIEISSSLLGEMNMYNILAAIAATRAYGIEWKAIGQGIEKIKIIPGRLEYVQREPFAAIVDYAHTPDALRKVYETLRNANNKSQITNNRLICVFGAAGGGRDTWKRPELGKIAGEFCDAVILTNEDPYDEDPTAILDGIAVGFSNDKLQITNYKILDRAEAIRQAIKDARSGDIVILTGKGSEQWIAGKDGTMIPWDEREVVKDILRQL